MPYVGNEPTFNFASVTKDLFSGDGSTTAFTLSKASTTNGVAVFVENVRQEPTIAYAVSGTTLTFTAAPVTSSGNNIYVLHHNAPASTVTHPAAQPLTATSGTFSAGVSGTTGTFTGDVSIDGGSFVFNESSADKDFRIESNGNANMFVVDAGTDTVCVGTNQTGFEASYDDLIVGSGTGHNGITVYSGNDSVGAVAFADATSGNATYDGYIQYEHNATQFTIGVNSGTTAKAFNITSAGNIKFPSGQGIDFSATSDGTTMASELLDDYEEGSFTPTVVSSSFTPSYNHQFGFYTKIGNKVTFEIYLAISSASGTTTNACTFGGLPFTSYNGSTASRYAGVGVVGSWYNGVVAQQGVPHMYISPNDTGIICVYWNGSTGVQMVGGDVDGNSFLYFGGFYQAA